jgi:hypothetical protein
MRIAIATLWGVGVSMLVCSLALAAPQGKVNFSGTWILDKSQSDIQQLTGLRSGAGHGQDASLSMMIEQQGTTLKVTRTLKADGAEKIETHIYKTDGTPTTNTGFRGESVVTEATWDGDKLVVHSIRTVKVLIKEVKVQSKAIWTLSPDGTTLTISAIFESPRGEQRVKGVFRKIVPHVYKSFD